MSFTPKQLLRFAANLAFPLKVPGIKKNPPRMRSPAIMKNVTMCALCICLHDIFVGVARTIHTNVYTVKYG